MSYLTVDDYLKHAARNEKSCLFIHDNVPRGHYFRWAFVVAYYTALSYFNAFLLKRGDPLPVRHKQYGSQQGDVDMAIDKFCSLKNGAVNSVGNQYEQLYQWSCDIRYNPKNSLLLSKDELRIAMEYLEEIKKVTQCEIGYIFRQNSKGSFKRVV